MILKIFSVLALYALCGNCLLFDDYYWREYNGEVPHDAVKGGDGPNGTTYVGQVLALDLSPVEIQNGTQDVYVPETYPVARRWLVKILCTNHPDIFRWYPTNSTKLKELLNHKTVIRGGYFHHDETPMYFGKIFYRDQIIIGRVFDEGSKSYAEFLYWENDRYNYYRSEVFDVLIYEDPLPPKRR